MFRVYGFGVLMFLLAGTAIFVVGRFVQRPPTELPMRPSSAWIAWHMSDLVGDRQTLKRELADLRNRSRIEISIYSASGELIESSADRPPPPLSLAEVQRLPHEPTRFEPGSGVIATLNQNGSVERYVKLTYPRTDVPLTVTTAQLVAALAVLALFSILLARSVTKPLERLAQVTHAFGQGNLSVRAHSKRRDELGDLARAFDSMADRLTELRRAEKELLANVSHELRTPLARIRIALDLVRGGDSHAAEGYFQDIEADLAELEHLLDDVMTTARLDMERSPVAEALPPLRREQIASEQLLEAARGRFARRNVERSLRYVVDAALPDLFVDPAMLRRAVDNLLDNAAKFSELGQDIALEGTREDTTGALIIRVKDGGAGIHADDLPHVFEPFFRADRSRARATGGVGLGLALTSRIVTAHGGEVWVESSNSDGTCFCIRVPAA